MTCRCIKPPTPAFLLHAYYTCEPIVGGMVVYDHKGFAWAGDRKMTCRCLTPPTPGFRKGFCYRCEPIIGGMVVCDDGGLAWAGDMIP